MLCHAYRAGRIKSDFFDLYKDITFKTADDWISTNSAVLLKDKKMKDRNQSKMPTGKVIKIPLLIIGASIIGVSIYFFLKRWE